MKLDRLDLRLAEKGRIAALHTRILDRLHARAYRETITWGEVVAASSLLKDARFSELAPDPGTAVKRETLRQGLACLVLIGALFAGGCVGGEQADTPYIRALSSVCTFITPTLVTPKASANSWKCEAGVKDYNRLFTIDLLYVDQGKEMGE